MPVEVVLPEGSYLSDFLDGLDAIEAQGDGLFYPESNASPLEDPGYPDLWGWLVAPRQRESFESAYGTRGPAGIVEGFESCFSYCRWLDAAARTARFIPAPARSDQPLSGHCGQAATWARFSSFGWGGAVKFDLACDLVSGRCCARILGWDDATAVEFKVAPAKLRPLATMREGVRYGEVRNGGRWYIYDGDHWTYALSTKDAVLMRGMRESIAGRSSDPIRQLFCNIRRSGLVKMRKAWGFTI